MRYSCCAHSSVYPLREQLIEPPNSHLASVTSPFTCTRGPSRHPIAFAMTHSHHRGCIRVFERPYMVHSITSGDPVHNIYVHRPPDLYPFNNIFFRRFRGTRCCEIRPRGRSIIAYHARTVTRMQSESLGSHMTAASEFPPHRKCFILLHLIEVSV